MFAIRGVAYDTGTSGVTGRGESSRTVWSTSRMEEELDLLSDQLNCNAVTVYGSDPARLADAATAAVERDLHVFVEPRLPDRPRHEGLDLLAESARLAERLRRQGAGVGLNVGAAQTVIAPDMVPGADHRERMANVLGDEAVDKAAVARSLNDYHVSAVAVARGIFQGEVGYSAAPFEDVDWRPFDSIGLMYEYVPEYRPDEEHVAELERHGRWDKPLLITASGTGTYEGAERRACWFWDVVDWSGDPPRVRDGYVRDEGAQADYHLRMFGVFERAGVRGVTVSDLIRPAYPHSSDPRLDLDVASAAIVKTIRDDISDPASGYRWEPKASFHAIADHYAHVGFQVAARG